jgi:hypothetical protein
MRLGRPRGGTARAPTPLFSVGEGRNGRGGIHAETGRARSDRSADARAGDRRVCDHSHQRGPIRRTAGSEFAHVGAGRALAVGPGRFLEQRSGARFAPARAARPGVPPDAAAQRIDERPGGPPRLRQGGAHLASRAARRAELGRQSGTAGSAAGHAGLSRHRGPHGRLSARSSECGFGRRRELTFRGRDRRRRGAGRPSGGPEPPGSGLRAGPGLCGRGLARIAFPS